ncbi:unnamed protein product, partial [Polarella glacialis]
MAVATATANAKVACASLDTPHRRSFSGRTKLALGSRGGGSQELRRTLGIIACFGAFKSSSRDAARVKRATARAASQGGAVDAGALSSRRFSVAPMARYTDRHFR